MIKKITMFIFAIFLWYLNINNCFAINNNFWQWDKEWYYFELTTNEKKIIKNIDFIFNEYNSVKNKINLNLLWKYKQLIDNFAYKKYTTKNFDEFLDYTVKINKKVDLIVKMINENKFKLSKKKKEYFINILNYIKFKLNSYVINDVKNIVNQLLK